MSQLSTQPMVRCRKCGKYMVLSHLSTTVPDESGDLLFEMMEMVGKRALCPSCQAQHDYYGSLGQGEDWEAGRVGGVILVSSGRSM